MSSCCGSRAICVSYSFRKESLETFIVTLVFDENRDSMALKCDSSNSKTYDYHLNLSTKNALYAQLG